MQEFYMPVKMQEKWNPVRKSVEESVIEANLSL